MARGDYASAVTAVFDDPPAPEKFRDRVETFCTTLEAARQEVVDTLKQATGREVRAPSPAIATPSQRAHVVPAPAELLEAIEIHREEVPEDAVAWLGFHVPLDNGFGIWTTMGVIQAGDHSVLEFEIFHL